MLARALGGQLGRRGSTTGVPVLGTGRQLPPLQGSNGRVPATPVGALGRIPSSWLFLNLVSAIVGIWGAKQRMGERPASQVNTEQTGATWEPGQRPPPRAPLSSKQGRCPAAGLLREAAGSTSACAHGARPGLPQTGPLCAAEAWAPRGGRGTPTHHSYGDSDVSCNHSCIPKSYVFERQGHRERPRLLSPNGHNGQG